MEILGQPMLEYSGTEWYYCLHKFVYLIGWSSLSTSSFLTILTLFQHQKDFWISWLRPFASVLAGFWFWYQCLTLDFLCMTPAWTVITYLPAHFKINSLYTLVAFGSFLPHPTTTHNSTQIPSDTSKTVVGLVVQCLHPVTVVIENCVLKKRMNAKKTPHRPARVKLQ